MMTKTETRESSMSDAELLRAIGHDLRRLYSEVIRQPLPNNIKAALARIEREQTRTGLGTHTVRQ